MRRLRATFSWTLVSLIVRRDSSIGSGGCRRQRRGQSDLRWMRSARGVQLRQGTVSEQPLLDTDGVYCDMIGRFLHGAEMLLGELVYMSHPLEGVPETRTQVASTIRPSGVRSLFVLIRHVA